MGKFHQFLTELSAHHMIVTGFMVLRFYCGHVFQVLAPKIYRDIKCTNYNKRQKNIYIYILNIHVLLFLHSLLAKVRKSSKYFSEVFLTLKSWCMPFRYF